MIQDLTEEQRRETEKVVRKHLGTSDDFLMTSVASQGQMNTFIRERATSRKMILTKFLDLGVFEKMLESAKDECKELQGQLKNVPDRDWDVAIYESKSALDTNRQDIQIIEDSLSRKRTVLHEMRLELSKFDNGDVVTHHDVDMQKTSIQSLEKKKFDNANLLLDLKEKIKSNKEKIKKITDFKEEFPIESLTESLEEQRSIKTNVLQVKATCEKEKINLENQLRSIAHLSEVPCGDKFPTCKFIKDSYNNQSLLEGQYRIIESLEEQIVTFEKLLTRLKKDKLEEKIKKYNLILNQEMSLQSIHNHLNFEIKKMKDDRVSIAQKIKEGKVLLEELKTNVVDADIDTKILLLKSQIQTITDEISQTDAKRISLAESAGKLESKLTNLRGEKLKFKALKDELKLYDLFINAVSKKGIPLQIILSQLPAINVEISKILQGVVGFTVDLEADPNSNQMDIYINYGDSKRVIELASGMEKMMASLAIRVALINVSSLPKTDLLVIDEGFGALDEMNVESCNRLLISLKRWFRNILVISHVDAVKDVVDNVIDITHKGKNAKVYVE
jgi:exonuclease SbcC